VWVRCCQRGCSERDARSTCPGGLEPKVPGPSWAGRVGCACGLGMPAGKTNAARPNKQHWTKSTTVLLTMQYYRPDVLKQTWAAQSACCSGQCPLPVRTFRQLHGNASVRKGLLLPCKSASRSDKETRNARPVTSNMCRCSESNGSVITHD
jgi:hypothetical protein